MRQLQRWTSGVVSQRHELLQNMTCFLFLFIRYHRGSIRTRTRTQTLFFFILYDDPSSRWRENTVLINIYTHGFFHSILPWEGAFDRRRNGPDVRLDLGKQRYLSFSLSLFTMDGTKQEKLKNSLGAFGFGWIFSFVFVKIRVKRTGSIAHIALNA